MCARLASADAVYVVSITTHMSMHVMTMRIAVGMSSVGIDIEVGGVSRGMLAGPPRPNTGTTPGGGEGNRDEERYPPAGLYAGTGNVGNSEAAGMSRHRRCRGGREGGRASTSESE